MSITKSFNNKTGIYYAYETTYEWSDEKQKKVQRKKCIGQFDPETGEVIPNGKVGRPSISKQKKKHKVKANAVSAEQSQGCSAVDIKNISAKLERLESVANDLSKEIRTLIKDLDSVSKTIK